MGTQRTDRATGELSMKEQVVGTRPQVGKQSPRPPQDQLSVPGLTEPLAASLGREILHSAATTEGDPVKQASLFRVAVLDDETEAAASVCACLCRHQIEAHAFTEPTEVVAALARADFDAFVLDWCLADETSADLVRALRLRSKPDAPIFILSGGMPSSGLAVDDQLADAIETYRLLFRTKPISCAVLAVDLKSAIESARCSLAQLPLL